MDERKLKAQWVSMKFIRNGKSRYILVPHDLQTNLLKGFIVNLNKDLDEVFNNPNRKEIYDLICKQNLNITQLSKKIKLSYKNTFFHVKKLEDIGLIRREKQQKSRGRMVLIVPTGKTLESIRKEREKAHSHMSQFIYIHF